MKQLENFVDQLFIRSIDLLNSEDWLWPPDWNKDQQHKFLDDSLSYAEEKQYFEQCAIIRDVKKTI